jgi:hypothetical protein
MLIMRVAVDVTTDAPTAAIEVCDLANKLGVVVHAIVDFQRGEMRARPGDSPGTVFDTYKREYK